MHSLYNGNDGNREKRNRVITSYTQHWAGEMPENLFTYIYSVPIYIQCHSFAVISENGELYDIIKYAYMQIKCMRLACQADHKP